MIKVFLKRAVHSTLKYMHVHSVYVTMWHKANVIIENKGQLALDKFHHPIQNNQKILLSDSSRTAEVMALS